MSILRKFYAKRLSRLCRHQQHGCQNSKLTTVCEAMRACVNFRGAELILERLRESSHAKVTSVKAQN